VGFYLVNFLSVLQIFLEFPVNWGTGPVPDDFGSAVVEQAGAGTGGCVTVR
jgi:hypothetical protein